MNNIRNIKYYFYYNYSKITLFIHIIKLNIKGQIQ